MKDLTMPTTITGDFVIGDRVELHPCTDLWMRGARYGCVVAIGRTLITVQLDRLARPVRVAPANVLHVE
jgi:hypothetical protein